MTQAAQPGTWGAPRRPLPPGTRSRSRLARALPTWPPTWWGRSAAASCRAAQEVGGRGQGGTGRPGQSSGPAEPGGGPAPVGRRARSSVLRPTAQVTGEQVTGEQVSLGDRWAWEGTGERGGGDEPWGGGWQGRGRTSSPSLFPQALPRGPRHSAAACLRGGCPAGAVGGDRAWLDLEPLTPPPHPAPMGFGRPSSLLLPSFEP